MNALLFAGALIALTVAVVESQRGDNARASARYWHKVADHRQRQTQRHEARIARLETALGRRTPGHWAPRRIQPVDTSHLCPTDEWLTEWGVIASDEPKLMGMAA